MALDAIRIDDDDFCFGTLPQLERSFGISLPQDLLHVATVGDLFDEILRLRQPTATGVTCDSSMVFYRLRRTFARLNPGQTVLPSTPLSQLTDLSPKALKKRIERETGLAMPAMEYSKGGCAVMVVALFAAPLLWWLVDVRAFAATGVIGVIAMMADRGGYLGNWSTVRSLAHAIARENVAQLAEMGARDRPEDWWRRFAEIIADLAQPIDGENRPLTVHRIARNTRIELV
ncbi:hypothetical protein EH30_01465 [Erythrobacter sp. JL475]|nr:hypothetical protein EH30_01465 [Erythrobacter sp. JL475]